MSQYGNYKEALKELKPKSKFKSFWNNLFNKDKKLKDNLFLVNLDNAKLKSVNQNIKKDIQKIIDKDGFVSDIQDYINEL